MPRRLFALLLALTLSPLAPAAEPPAACGRVTLPQPDGVTYYNGSGTVIASEGGCSLVLTNRHVAVRLGARGTFTPPGGGSYPVCCVAVDDASDLALLHTPHALPAAPLALRDPPAGAELTQYGHPYAGPCRPRRSRFLGFRGLCDTQWGRAAARTVHATGLSVEGESGSGLFHNGELVAVCWGNDYHNQCCVELSNVHRLTRLWCEKTKLFPELRQRVSQPASESKE